MLKWLHHIFNPHCPECREEREKETICPSCEILKVQVEKLTYDNEKLLNRILEKPEIETDKPRVEITPPRNIPWNVRRQILEKEDREKARLMRDAPKPDKISTEDLEKELDIAARTREAEASVVR